MQWETLRSSECGVRRPAHNAAESVIKAGEQSSRSLEPGIDARIAARDRHAIVQRQPDDPA